LTIPPSTDARNPESSQSKGLAAEGHTHNRQEEIYSSCRAGHRDLSETTR
jgi:hypothetical protein